MQEFRRATSDASGTTCAMSERSQSIHAVVNDPCLCSAGPRLDQLRSNMVIFLGIDDIVLKPQSYVPPDLDMYQDGDYRTVHDLIREMSNGT